jgi:hypothetical protein
VFEDERPSRRAGYTLAECMVAFGVAMTIITIVMQMYSQGNQMSEKGVWRTTCTNQLRLAMRRIKEAIEATSYPTYVDNTGIWEASPVAFTSTGDLASFYCCRPLEGANLGTATTSGNAAPGTGTAYKLSLASWNQNRFAPLQLVWVRTPGTITGTNTPKFTAGTSGPVESLCTDVTGVDITMPNIPSPITTPTDGITLRITIKTADPLNGRSTMSESLMAKTNVAVAYL